MSEQGEEVEEVQVAIPRVVTGPIPEDMLVQCPIYSFEFRKASKCQGCVELHGIIQIAAEGCWDDMHRIACRHPIMRKLFKVNEE